MSARYSFPACRLSEGEEEGVSVAAIKSSVKSRLAHGGYESEEGSSDDGAERLMRAKVEESMALRKPRTEDGDGESSALTTFNRNIHCLIPPPPFLSHSLLVSLGAKRQKRGRKLVLSSEESD